MVESKKLKFETEARIGRGQKYQMIGNQLYKTENYESRSWKFIIQVEKSCIYPPPQIRNTHAGQEILYQKLPSVYVSQPVDTIPDVYQQVQNQNGPLPKVNN